jgi:hypothetical protein
MLGPAGEHLIDAVQDFSIEVSRYPCRDLLHLAKSTTESANSCYVPRFLTP